MNLTQVESVTEQLKELEPLRVSAEGPELYAVLRALNAEVGRVLQGPWSPDDLHRVGAVVAAPPSDAAPLDSRMVAAEAAFAEAEAEFERADGLWNQATVALLALENRSRRVNQWGEPLPTPDRVKAQQQEAQEEQKAAMAFREEALQSFQAARVARNKLAYAFQQERVHREYRESLAKADEERQAQAQQVRERNAASLERLAMRVPS